MESSEQIKHSIRVLRSLAEARLDKIGELRAYIENQIKTIVAQNNIIEDRRKTIVAQQEEIVRLQRTQYTKIPTTRTELSRRADAQDERIADLERKLNEIVLTLRRHRIHTD